VLRNCVGCSLVYERGNSITERILQHHNAIPFSIAQLRQSAIHEHRLSTDDPVYAGGRSRQARPASMSDIESGWGRGLGGLQAQ
jgi:hypothetical protein